MSGSNNVVRVWGSAYDTPHTVELPTELGPAAAMIITRVRVVVWCCVLVLCCVCVLVIFCLRVCAVLYLSIASFSLTHRCMSVHITWQQNLLFLLVACTSSVAAVQCPFKPSQHGKPSASKPVLIRNKALRCSSAEAQLLGAYTCVVCHPSDGNVVLVGTEVRGSPLCWCCTVIRLDL